MNTDNKIKVRRRWNRIKLNQAHRTFIMVCVARHYRPREIWKMLKDKQVADEHHFDPIDMNPSSIWKQIKKIDPADIEKQREIYYMTLSDIRLASKKERVLELVKIYNKPSVSLKDKAQILKQIREEVGEDFDKYLEAVKNQGRGGNLNIVVFEKERQDKMERGLNRFGYTALDIPKVQAIEQKDNDS